MTDDTTHSSDDHDRSTGSDAAGGTGGPGGDAPNESVRHEDFTTDGPIEMDVSTNSGSVVVELTESPRTHVEVRHDPDAGGFDWRSGLNGLLNWVGEQFGEAGIRPGGAGSAENSRGGAESRRPPEPVSEAVRHTRVDLTGNRLVVRPSGTTPLRTVPLAIRVQAPKNSQIDVHTGSADVTISGSAGRVKVETGTGAASVERTSGNTTVRTGSGRIKLGTVEAGAQARSGSGDVEIASVEAASSVVTGSGDVWLGAVSGDVLVRSGSGDVTIADAVAGQTELINGSGQLRVSLRKGVAAEIDLSSSVGEVNSDLPVSEEPPEQEPALRIFGRTGTGDALVTSAI